MNKIFSGAHKALPVLLATAFASVAFIVPAVTTPTAAADETTAGTTTSDTSSYETVTADALPTVQVDGVVWDQTIVGNTVYAVGEFTTARPAGSPAGENEVPRHNALAYNLETGELLDWAPDVNGAVYSVVANEDGTRIYLGGAFTQVSGNGRFRIAEVTPTTARVTGFNVGTNSAVRAMALHDGVLYIGGSFTQVNDLSRSRLAAIDLSDPSGVVTKLNANVNNGSVQSIAVRPDDTQVVIGGSFTSVNSSSDPGYGLAVLDAKTGNLTNTDVNAVVRNATSYGSITSLQADDEGFYATAYSYSRTYANLEGAFKMDWDSADIDWMSDCHGDEYDLTVDGDVVYTAGHTHFCANIGGWEEKDVTAYHHAVAYTNAATGTISKNTESDYTDFSGQPATSVLTFFPKFTSGTYTSSEQATWTVESNDDYVVYGGEFTAVNGVAQQGLVRFAKPKLSTNAQGPEIKGGSWKLNATALSSDTVSLSVSGNYDNDDDTLTYTVERDTPGNTVAKETKTIDWWALGTLTFTDSGLAAGSQHRYRVVVTDPDGNSTSTDWTDVTTLAAGASPVATGRTETILQDGATDLWALNASSNSSKLNNEIGSAALTTSNVTLGVGGPTGGEGTAASFQPTTRRRWFWNETVDSSACSSSVSGTGTYSVETWIRTSSNQGGVVAGFQKNSVSSSVRAIYTLDDGRIAAHAQAGRTVVSSKSYNDGQWHHVVVTLGGQGQILYVDGEQVAIDPTTRVVAPSSGYWCVGTGDVSDMSPAPSTTGFTGDVEELAIYPTALSATVVAAHAGVATPTTPEATQTPTAEATTTPSPAATTAPGDTATASPADGSDSDPSDSAPADEDGNTENTPTVYAADNFDGRTESGGWGTSPDGTSWNTSWGRSKLSVSQDSALVDMPSAGSSALWTLGQQPQDSQTVSLDLTVPQLPQGGAEYLSVLGRSSDAGSYRTKLVIGADGKADVQLTGVNGSTETVLASASGAVDLSEGQTIHLLMRVEGTNTTNVSAKVWADGDVEPTGWTLTAVDAKAGPQEAGVLGFYSYLSGKATAGAQVRVDNVQVTSE